MSYPFLRLVFPSFIVMMITAGFYISDYISPPKIPMIGVFYFVLMSILAVLLSVGKCIRNQKSLLYILLGVFVVHAIYFVLLYVYAKPYRDSLEKDLDYLWAMCFSWLLNSFWVWICLPRKFSKSFEHSKLASIFLANFFVLIIIMFMAPNYCDYTDRTYISEGMMVAAGAKAASTEFYGEEKRFPKDNQEAGLLEPSEIVGQSVKAVAIMPQGKIKIIYSNRLADNAFIILEAILDAKDEITWRCYEIDRLEVKMLPSSCRTQIQS